MPQDPNRQISLEEFEEQRRQYYGLPKGLVESLKTQESGGQQYDPKTGGVLTSPKKAKGRFQVVQSTADKYGLNADDPFENTEAAFRYLSDLNKQVDPKITDPGERWATTLNGYHAGEGRLRDVNKTGNLTTGSDGNMRTADYVGAVMKRWQDYDSGQTKQERGAATSARTAGLRRQGLNAIDFPEGKTYDLGTGTFIEPSQASQYKPPSVPLQRPGRLSSDEKFAQEKQIDEMIRSGATREQIAAKRREFDAAAAARPAVSPERKFQQEQEIAGMIRRGATREEINQARQRFDAEQPVRQSPLREAVSQFLRPAITGTIGIPQGVIDLIESLGNIGSAADLAMNPEYQRMSPAEKAQVNAGVRQVQRETSLAERMRPTTRGAQRAVESAIPVNPGNESWLTAKIPSAFGSAVPFFVGGLAGRAIGLPSMASAGILGSAMEVDQVAQEMEQAGVDPERRDRAILAAGAIGLTEMLGLGRALDKIGLKRPLIHRAVEILEEGGQEALQQWLENVNAAYIGAYAPGRRMSEGVGEAAILGAIVGGGFQGLDVAGERLMRRGEQPAAVPQQPTTAPLAARTTTPLAAQTTPLAEPPVAAPATEAERLQQLYAQVEALTPQGKKRAEAAQKAAKVEQDRLNLYNEAQTMASEAADRAQTFIDAGDLRGAANEMLAQQDALREQMGQIPKTPEGLRERDAINRQIRDLGDRVKDLGQQQKEAEKQAQQAAKKPQPAAPAVPQPTPQTTEPFQYPTEIGRRTEEMPPVPNAPETGRMAQPQEPDTGQRLIERTRAKAEELIEQGRYGEAEAELLANLQALKSAKAKSRKRPGEQARLAREIGLAGNRIGEIRKMRDAAAKQKRVAENAPTAALPGRSNPLLKSNVNPEGGVPATPPPPERRSGIFGALARRQEAEAAEAPQPRRKPTNTLSPIEYLKRKTGNEGIRVSDRGEAANLGAKEEGIVGLVNGQSKWTVNDAAVMLDEGGFRMPDGRTFTDPSVTENDVLDYLREHGKKGRQGTREMQAGIDQEMADYYANQPTSELTPGVKTEVPETGRIAQQAAPPPTSRRPVPREATTENLPEIRNRREELSRLKYDRTQEPGGEFSDDLNDELSEIGSVIKQYENRKEDEERGGRKPVGPPTGGRDYLPIKPEDASRAREALNRVEPQITAELQSEIAAAEPDEADLIERGIEAIDRMFEDDDAVEMLDRAVADPNLEDDFIFAVERAYGIQEDVARSLVESRRAARQRESQNARQAAEKGQGEARPPEMGAERRTAEVPRPLTKQDQALIETAPRDLEILEVDPHLRALENLRNDQTRGLVNLPDWALRQLLARITDTNNYRKELVDKGLLPAKHEPRVIPGKRLTKEEGGRRLVQQMGGREERVTDTGEKEPLTVTHPNPDIDGKPIIARTDDGRVIVENPENRGGVSVVKDRGGEKTVRRGDIIEYEGRRWEITPHTGSVMMVGVNEAGEPLPGRENFREPSYEDFEKETGYKAIPPRPSETRHQQRFTIDEAFLNKVSDGKASEVEKSIRDRVIEKMNALQDLALEATDERSYSDYEGHRGAISGTFGRLANQQEAIRKNYKRADKMARDSSLMRLNQLLDAPFGETENVQRFTPEHAEQLREKSERKQAEKEAARNPLFAEQIKPEIPKRPTGELQPKQSVQDILNEEIERMRAERKAKQAKAPGEKGQRKPVPRPGLPEAGKQIRSAGRQASEGLKEAAKGLMELFGTAGGTKLSINFTFNEDTYTLAKPHFEKAIASFKGAAEDVRGAIRALLDYLQDEYGDAALDAIEGMQPYIERFFEERTGEAVESAPSEVETNERRTAETEHRAGNREAGVAGEVREGEGGLRENAEEGYGNERRPAGVIGNEPAARPGRTESDTGAAEPGAEQVPPRPGQQGRGKGKGKGKEGPPQAGELIAIAEAASEPMAAGETVVQAAAENLPPEPAPPSENVRPGPEKEPKPKTPKKYEAKPSQQLKTLTGASYTFTPETIEQIESGGQMTKLRQNMAAIELMRKIVQAGRQATREEQEKLALYAGFGGIKPVFYPYDYSVVEYKDQKKWREAGDELRELIGDDAFADAKKSTQNAHYTSPRIVQAMWRMAEKLGYKGGRVLEPSMGSGNFLGLTPEALREKTAFTGVELDPTTGAVAQLIYPDANIKVMGFEELQVPDNFYDVAIGNVPFGESRLSDPRYNKFSALIHNYFFLKSIDKVRPGGLLMFITSTGTMDAADAENVRKYLHERADLVAAIRLPADTFKNALTSVVTDLIILRKRLPGEKPGSDLWTRTGKVASPEGQQVYLNRYFDQNRDRMLGEFTGYNKLHPGARAGLKSTEDFEQRLERAIEDLPENKMTDRAAALQAEFREAGKKVKSGAYVVEDGKLYRNEQGGLVEEKADEARIQRVEGMLKIRDLLNKLTDAELGRSEENPNRLRREMGEAYDRFVGMRGFISEKANVDALEGDPDLPRLMALEDYDPKTKRATKRPIFEKSTIVGAKVDSKPKDMAEAVIKSFQMRGEIVLPMISESLGITQAEAAAELTEKGIAFQTPAGNWEIASRYLSGNVRRKLAEARAAAENDPFFEANVKALEGVVPPDVPHTEISVAIGAPWIEPGDISAFVGELFNEDANDVFVHYDRPTGAYIVKTDEHSRAKISREALTTWGTPELPFLDLLDLALAGKQAKVTETVREPGGTTRTIFLPQETQAAQTKLDAIKQRFKEWVWEDPARRERLSRRYNEMFSALRPSEYDASFMLDESGGAQVPGMNPNWKLRPHQMSAVLRGVVEKRGLLAHEVGLGKTLAMIATASELKRLGIASKPAIAVPKKVLPGFAEAARKAFPLMKVHVIDGRDAMKRQRTMSQIATGDHDLVLMTHDNMDMLKMRPEFEAQILRKELDEVNAVYNAIASENARRGVTKKSPAGRIQKQIENRRDKLAARIHDALRSERKDEAITFEDTGIDFLFVDEFHKYKTLPVVTALGQIKGVPTGDSQRAINMLMRARYLQQLNGGGGLITATGTPISNTLVEAYIMSKFLQPDVMEESGVESFDAWARNFAEVVSAMEFDATGRWKPVNRMSKFKNLPELQLLSRVTLDVKTAKETGILEKRPKRRDKAVAIRMTPTQAVYMQALRERADAIKKGDVEDWEDNYLVVSNDGRMMSADIRLVLPGMEEEADGKVAALVNEVARISKEKPGKTQMIFSDVGIHPNAWGFNLYDEITNKLVASGIPRDKIINFQKLDSDAKVEKAIDRLNSGDALIAIGHRETMGTGVNAQRYIAAVHQFDATWKPALIEQSEARGWRQGNENEDIEIVSYVVEGSFDAVMWATVARKQQGISSFMRGQATEREMTEEDGEQLSYEMIAATASGDGDYLRKAELDQRVFKLELMERAHEADRLNREREIPNIEGRIESLERQAVRMDDRGEWAQKIQERDVEYVDMEGKVQTERAEAAKAMVMDFATVYKVLEASKKRDKEPLDIGKYKGLQMYVSIFGDLAFQMPPYKTALQDRDTIKVNTENYAGTIQSFDATIAGLTRGESQKYIRETQIPSLKKDLASLQQIKHAPFPYRKQLETARKQLDVVKKRLEAKEAEKADTGEPLIAKSGLDVRMTGELGRRLRRGVREKEIKPSEVPGILARELPRIKAQSQEAQEAFKEYTRKKTAAYIGEHGLEEVAMRYMAKTASQAQAAYGEEYEQQQEAEREARRRRPVAQVTQLAGGEFQGIGQRESRASLFAAGKTGQRQASQNYWGTQRVAKEPKTREQKLAVFRDARSEFREKRGEPGTLWLNHQSTLTMASASAEVGADIPTGGFSGVAMHVDQLQKIGNFIQNNAGQKGPVRDALLALADNIEAAIDDAKSNGRTRVVMIDSTTGPISEVKSTVREERFHRWQIEGGLFNQRAGTALHRVLETDPAYQKVRAALIKKKYPADNHMMIVSEAAAKVASGQWKDYGLDSEQEGLDLLHRYYRAAARMVGVDTLMADATATPQARKVQEDVREILTGSRRGRAAAVRSGSRLEDLGTAREGAATPASMGRGYEGGRREGSETPHGREVPGTESAGTALDRAIGAKTDLGAREMANYAITGAAKPAKGAVSFAEWSKAMVKQFGEKVRPHLLNLWQRAKALQTTTPIEQLVENTENLSSWKDWYDRHHKPIEDLFQDDAPLFRQLLAATSQHSNVKSNVTLALKAYRQIKSGEPFTGYLRGVVLNLERIRNDEQITGPKIGEFGKGMTGGDINAMAVDMHVAEVLFGTKAPTPKQVERAKFIIRTIAGKLGWTPIEAQSALWAYNQIRQGKEPTDYEQELRKRADEIRDLRAALGGGERGSVSPGARSRRGIEEGRGVRTEPGARGPIRKFLAEEGGAASLGLGLGNIGRRATAPKPKVPLPADWDISKWAQKATAELGALIKSGNVTKKQVDKLVDAITNVIEATKDQDGAKLFLAREELAKLAASHITVGDVAGAPRTLVAGLDLSYTFRQGGAYNYPGLVVAPIETVKRILRGASAMREGNYGYWNAKIAASPRANEMRLSGLHLSNQAKVAKDNRLNDKEDNYITRMTQDIPGYKQSERGNTTLLDMLRAEKFNQYAEYLEKNGKTFQSHPRAFKQMAKFVNLMTGRGSLGDFDSAIPFLSLGLFSPRWVISRGQLLALFPKLIKEGVADKFRPGRTPKIDPTVRKLMWRDMGAYAGVMGVTLGLLAAASAAGLANIDVGGDPEESDFGKVVINGKHHYDLTGGLQQYVVLAVRLAHSFIKRGRGEKLEDYQKPSEIVLRFARGKASPAASLAADIFTGQDYRGQPITVKGALLNQVYVLTVKDFMEGWNVQGNALGGLWSLPAILGVPYNAFERGGEAVGAPEFAAEARKRGVYFNARVLRGEAPEMAKARAERRKSLVTQYGPALLQSREYQEAESETKTKMLKSFEDRTDDLANEKYPRFDELRPGAILKSIRTAAKAKDTRERHERKRLIYAPAQ